MRFIARNSIIRASLLCSATINFFNFVFWALFVLYASRELHVRPGLLGAILGARDRRVIGSVITGRVGRRIRIGPATCSVPAVHRTAAGAAGRRPHRKSC
jgi:hypothetical protein